MSKIEELKKAFEASTPGEWAFVPPGANTNGEVRPFGAVVVAPHRVICAEGKSRKEAEANTEFIALAHNLMPELLAKSEAFEAIKARVNGEFDNPALVRLGPLNILRYDILRIIGGMK